MNTDNMDRTARIFKAFGTITVLIAILYLYMYFGILGYNIGRIDNLLDKVLYFIGTVLFSAGFVTLLVLPLIDGERWSRVSRQAQADAVMIDGEYYIDEGGNRILGRLTHYDYQRGCVWQQWNTENGYHERVVRKLTKAEIREDEVLRSGGYGGMNYGG